MTKAIFLQTQWVQPKSFHNRYELRAGDELFAVLEFPKMFGSLALACTEDGRWTLKRVGFFKTRVTIREEGQDSDLGVYFPRWTGSEGTLHMTGGAEFTWKAANFWATQFIWLDTAGKTLLSYRPGVEESTLSDVLKTQARVEFMPEARNTAELPLLVVLGWYLMIMKQQDDTAAVAATSA